MTTYTIKDVLRAGINLFPIDCVSCNTPNVSFNAEGEYCHCVNCGTTWDESEKPE